MAKPSNDISAVVVTAMVLQLQNCRDVHARFLQRAGDGTTTVSWGRPVVMKAVVTALLDERTNGVTLGNKHFQVLHVVFAFRGLFTDPLRELV